MRTESKPLRWLRPNLSLELSHEEEAAARKRWLEQHPDWRLIWEEQKVRTSWAMDCGKQFFKVVGGGIVSVSRVRVSPLAPHFPNTLTTHIRFTV